jgi:hypothetical protein
LSATSRDDGPPVAVRGREAIFVRVVKRAEVITDEALHLHWRGHEQSGTTSATHELAGQQVRYRSDKSDGPTAGTETVDPLEFLARLTAHIPNKHQVMTRYYGYYANRVRGARRRREETAPVPGPVVEPVPLLLREARRRWAELLRQIFEVDPLRCPQCGAEMRVIAFITQRAVIDRILDHLHRGRESARGPPSTQPSTQRRARVSAAHQST